MIPSLLKNQLYIKEHEEHRLFCNGYGEILEINKFTGEAFFRDCPFCKRLSHIKAQRELEKNAKG